MKLRVAVVTLGCKVNQYESRAIEETLAGRGHALVKLEEGPEMVVINTCTVTHRSDADARAVVRRARRANPDARIITTGCYAQTDPEALRELGVDLVVGVGGKTSIADFAEQGRTGTSVEAPGLAPLAPEVVSGFEGKARAFFKVQDGCDAFCSYCIVPHARGPSRSLPPEEVERGLGRLAKAGHREVVLTGVHLGFWGRDFSPPLEFSRLLDMAEGSGIPRIRLSSIEPLEITDGLIGRLGSETRLCPHLHIPLQSGSDKILKLMGRPYTVKHFKDKVNRALARVKGLCLGFDVIVGFPGETEDDFGDTFSLLEAIPFGYLHVFPFSPRKNTPAASMEGKVSPEVVKARAAALRDLSREKQKSFYEAQLGTLMAALPEGEPKGGMLKARTRNYVPVSIKWDAPAPKDEIMVELKALEGSAVAADPVNRAGRT